MTEETSSSQCEVLGASATADVAAIRRALTSLALLRIPAKCGAPEQRVQVNAVYELGTTRGLKRDLASPLNWHGAALPFGRQVDAGSESRVAAK